MKKKVDKAEKGNGSDGIAPLIPAARHDGIAPLIPAAQSYKVLAECPLVINTLFHLHQKQVAKNVLSLMPLMLANLRVLPTLPLVCADNSLIGSYNDLFSAQVKTLPVVTYYINYFPEVADLVRNSSEDNLVRNAVVLLRRCPDAIHLRKELFLAVRHILATEFKHDLLPYLDELLEGSIFLGPSRHESVKPMAYNTLTDLTLKMEPHLTLAHLQIIVECFCKNIHDSSLPTAIQTAAVKLVNYFTELISQKQTNTNTNTENGEKPLELLAVIFRAHVNKLKALKQTIHVVSTAKELHDRRTQKMILRSEDVKAVQNGNNRSSPRNANRSPLVMSQEWELSLITSRNVPKEESMAEFIVSEYYPGHPYHESRMKDLKVLVKTMIRGMPALLMRVQIMQIAVKNDIHYKELSVEMCELQRDYFRLGLECCYVFTENSTPLSPVQPPSAAKAFAASTVVLVSNAAGGTVASGATSASANSTSSSKHLYRSGGGRGLKGQEMDDESSDPEKGQREGSNKKKKKRGANGVYSTNGNSRDRNRKRDRDRDRKRDRGSSDRDRDRDRDSQDDDLENEQEKEKKKNAAHSNIQELKSGKCTSQSKFVSMSISLY